MHISNVVFSRDSNLSSAPVMTLPDPPPTPLHMENSICFLQIIFESFPKTMNAGFVFKQIMY